MKRRRRGTDQSGPSESSRDPHDPQQHAEESGKQSSSPPVRLIERKAADAVVAHSAADFVLRFGGFEETGSKAPARAQLDGFVSIAVRLVFRLEEPPRELARLMIELGYVCRSSADGTLHWHGHLAVPSPNMAANIAEPSNSESPTVKHPSRNVEDLGAIRFEDVDGSLLSIMASFAHSISVSSNVANVAAIGVALLAYKIVAAAAPGTIGIARNFFEVTAKVGRLSADVRDFIVLVEQRMMFCEVAAEREIVDAASKLLFKIRQNAGLTSKDLYVPLPRGTAVPTRFPGDDGIDSLMRSFGIGTTRVNPQVSVAQMGDTTAIQAKPANLPPFTLDVDRDERIQMWLPESASPTIIAFSNGSLRRDKVFAGSQVARFLLAAGRGFAARSFSESTWKRARRAIKHACGSALSLVGTRAAPRFAPPVTVSSSLASRDHD